MYVAPFCPLREIAGIGRRDAPRRRRPGGRQRPDGAIVGVCQVNIAGGVYRETLWVVGSCTHRSAAIARVTTVTAAGDCHDHAA